MHTEGSGASRFGFGHASSTGSALRAVGRGFLKAWGLQRLECVSRAPILPRRQPLARVFTLLARRNSPCLACWGASVKTEGCFGG